MCPAGNIVRDAEQRNRGAFTKAPQFIFFRSILYGRRVSSINYRGF
jgi:hypothetical protein